MIGVQELTIEQLETILEETKPGVGIFFSERHIPGITKYGSIVRALETNYPSQTWHDLPKDTVLPETVTLAVYDFLDHYTHMMSEPVISDPRQEI